MRYCENCGSLLEQKEHEQRLRLWCPRCSRVCYEQLKVGAGAVIEQAGRLLLLRRTQSPFHHRWNLPAGYVDITESPAQAAVRETYEETRLQVEAKRLLDVYFFDDDPRGNGILIVYACNVIGGELAESSESMTPTFFAPGDVPADLAGGGHDRAILAWQKAQPKDGQTHH